MAYFVKKDRFYFSIDYLSINRNPFLMTSDVYKATAFDLNDAESYAAAIHGYVAAYFSPGKHDCSLGMNFYCLQMSGNCIWWNFSTLDDIRNQF